MQVFFASSTAKLFEYYPIYKAICSIITELGHKLTRDWLDDAVMVQEEDLKVNFDEMYADIIESIISADVGIVEGTVKGLTTGHQMTVALQKGKPVLYLHKKREKDMFPFIVGDQESHLLTERVYNNKEEIPDLVKEFFVDQRKGKRIRFNLVLNSNENKYVDWASHTQGKSKTEIIRETIQERTRRDSEYQRIQKN